MIVVSLELPFSATHQITLVGVLEPVHGHDFRCRAEFVVDDERDAELLRPALEAVLEPLVSTHLQGVRATEEGHPSAERIARHLHRALTHQLSGDRRARVWSVTVHEAPGCSATYR